KSSNWKPTKRSAPRRRTSSSRSGSGTRISRRPATRKCATSSPAARPSRRSMVFEVLHGPLVLLGLGAGGESTEVAAFAGARIELARVEPVLARFQFADHGRALNEMSSGNVQYRCRSY